MDDPFSLLACAVWTLAMGMYPLGFMFGVCSACCDEGPCVCGARDANFNFATANDFGKQRADQADWCCNGSAPQEITVRVSNAVSTPSGTGGAGDVVTPFCDQVEGDYVLMLRNSQNFCYYQYEPTCEVDCPEREYDEEEDVFLTPAIPLFLPGIAIVAFPGRQSPFAEIPSITAANFVEGDGYEFGVRLYARINAGGPGGSGAENHCEVYWGVPAEIEDVSAGGTGLSQASPAEPILLGDFQTGGVAQAFESSQCDMRGNFSNTMGGRPFSMTLNDSHVDAGTTLSLEDCDATVFKRSNAINTWGNNITQGSLPPFGAQSRCDWDVEILAP